MSSPRHGLPDIGVLGRKASKGTNQGRKVNATSAPFTIVSLPCRSRRSDPQQRLRQRRRARPRRRSCAARLQEPVRDPGEDFGEHDGRRWAVLVWTQEQIAAGIAQPVT